MNILPFVFAFLLIFSYLATSFVKEVKSAHEIEWLFQGYNHTEKAVRNGMTRRLFDKLKSTQTTDLAVKKTDKKAPTLSRRVSFPPLDTSKFYLKAILAPTYDEIKHHPLYEPLAELLRILYKERLFIPYEAETGVEYALIESFAKTLQESPIAHELSDLYPNDPKLSKLYYKMLKGTNKYSIKEGIPPLHHFLSLEKSDKGVHISLSSEPVLLALFGEKITKEILQKEQKELAATQKHYAFSQQDFENLLNAHPNENALLTSLRPFISYSKKVAKKQSLARRDAATQIGIEKEIHTNCGK